MNLDEEADLQRRFGGLERLYGVAGAAGIRAAHVAVVGVPDERMGEVGMAFIVPRDGVQIDTDAIASWARDTMANFKVPRHFRVVDALPTNASGKVVKVELRALGRAELGID